VVSVIGLLFIGIRLFDEADSLGFGEPINLIVRSNTPGIFANQNTGGVV
jgi:hypothetical protein